MGISLQTYIVRDSAQITQALEVIKASKSRCAIVVNDEDKVVGVFSEGDVLSALLRGTSIKAPLKQVLRPSFHYLHSRDFHKAYTLAKTDGITLLPIVDEEFHLCEVLTLFDLLSALELRNEAP